MIVTVASGKGGTGKTTVAVNLAASFPDGAARIFDCDVEEPNAHLFVRPEERSTEEISTMVPSVEMELCTLCGECEKICRFSAITIIARKVMVFPEMCHSCYGCSMVCPTGAVKESSRVLGNIHKGTGIRDMELTWGLLRVGEAMSPPLIKHVKKRISPERIAVIDAPPGTSCPAVTTLKNSDFVLLVAEESPFGLNDLSLTVEVLKKLGVPMGIVINRADCTESENPANRASVSDNGCTAEVEKKRGIIDDYAKGERIEILQRLPFSREAAGVCSRGLLLIDEIPSMKRLFEELREKVVKRVKKRLEDSADEKSGAD